MKLSQTYGLTPEQEKKFDRDIATFSGKAFDEYKSLHGGFIDDDDETRFRLIQVVQLINPCSFKLVWIASESEGREEEIFEPMAVGLFEAVFPLCSGVDHLGNGKFYLEKCQVISGLYCLDDGSLMVGCLSGDGHYELVTKTDGTTHQALKC